MSVAPAMTDDVFPDHVAERLAALPGVRAVALGGSRAQGTQRPDSDWDFAIYYRGDFQPDDLRGVGWEGEVSEIGGWGGGVFNGGAWLTVDGRRVDVHYRDLDVVERELAEAERGRVRWEPLMFHLAGIPTYLVVAELAVNQVLRGTAPRPDRYPEALRKAAPEMWWGRASGTLRLREGQQRAPRAAGPRSTARSPWPRCRPRTPSSPPAVSGSPTRSGSWSARACWASTACSRGHRAT